MFLPLFDMANILIKSQKFWSLIPKFVGVTVGKMVGNLSAGGGGGGGGWGGEFFQNCHKFEIYLIGENFVEKKFSLGKPFATQPVFRHFSRTKIFPKI